MDEQMLRGILAEMLEPIHQRLGSVEDRLTSLENRMSAVEDRLSTVENRLTNVESELGLVKNRLTEVEKCSLSMEKSLENLKTQLNGVEYRVIDVGDSVRLAVRQTSSEMGELRHDLSWSRQK